MWRIFGSSTTLSNEDAGASSQEEQIDQFNDAMKGLMHVLNDDLPAAEEVFTRSHSVFHQMGRGTTLFIKGLLSFESEVLREASRVLLDGGAAATEQRRRCLQDPRRSALKFYPAGSEYTVCLESTQILRCILAILDTNVTESLKGFYNVRKAYHTFGSLASVSEAHSGRSTPLLAQTPAISSRGASIKDTAASSKTTLNNEGDGDDEFHDAEDDEKPNPDASQAPIDGSLHDQAMSQLDGTNKLPGLDPDQPNGGRTISTSNGNNMNPVDRFVQTGSSVGFGALLLGISLVPPIFATLLKIVGFTGDRARGLELLWRGAEADDGYGSVGALILFEYYNAIGSLCEIVTEELYPRPRLQKLLASMRARFPDGRLWKMYEASFASADRDVERAIRLMDKDNPSPLKQMQSLQMFVHSVYSMYMHRYEECRRCFEDGVALNERSHALHYYVAGAATVALYRQAESPEAASQYAEDASRLFELALSSAGQKRFLSKRIPFEVFIIHKIQKWKARAKAKGIDLIAAVGTSPIDEAIYFWNGYRRLPAESLEQSMANVERETDGAAGTENEELDEQAIRVFLKAVILRNMDKHEDAKKLLRQVQSMEQDSSKDADNWMQPLACYEMAITLWQELDGSSEDDERLRECLSLIEKVEKWEAFNMQDAFSIQLTMARESIQSRLANKPSTDD